jgi:hypothetical protein
MMKKIQGLSLIACVGLLAVPVFSQAQVANGGFDDDSAWERSPATDPATTPLIGGAYADTSTGAGLVGVDLGLEDGESASDASLSQDITLAAGDYVLSYDLLVKELDAAGVDTWTVSYGGATLFSGSAADDGGSHAFTATGDGTLMFLLSPNGNSEQDNSDTQLSLDNVAISPVVVPEPGTWAVMAMGGLGLLGLVRRRK